MKILIFGAGLDVFEKEPVNTDNPLLKNKKVIIKSPFGNFYKRM